MKNTIHDPRFFEGGNALFTVSNPTGERYTYKIRKPRPTTPYFVSLLTGPDNRTSYTYIGLYIPQRPNDPIQLTQKSKLPPTSTPIRVFSWAVRLIRSGRPIPQGYAIQHEGRCCRCGRVLTVPESIERGIGPECAGILV